MKNNFETFLMDKHAKDYTGIKDQMIDSFEKWISELQVDDFIELADKYASIIRTQTIEEVLKEVEKKGLTGLSWEKVKDKIRKQL